MSVCWLRVGPKSMESVFVRDRRGRTEDTGGRPSEDWHRDENYAPLNQGSGVGRPGAEKGKRILSSLEEEAGPTDPSIWDFCP